MRAPYQITENSLKLIVSISEKIGAINATHLYKPPTELRKRNRIKTIYDNYIPLDSEFESQFANDCESSEQVEFYFRLPSWFKIPTPIGNYNPDWALIFKDEKKIYFVAETKSTKDLSRLRNDERLKIKCGEKHFAVIDEVEYRHVTKLGELVE